MLRPRDGALLFEISKFKLSDLITCKLQSLKVIL